MCGVTANSAGPDSCQVNELKLKDNRQKTLVSELGELWELWELCESRKGGLPRIKFDDIYGWIVVMSHLNSFQGKTEGEEMLMY